MDELVPILHRLDGRTIRVWPVADVHIGSAQADVDGFRGFLSKIAQDPDSYIILCGDLMDNSTRDSIANVYDATIPPAAQIDMCCELLYPTRDRILGAVGGNHEARTIKQVGIDPTAQLMTMLGIPELYRRGIAFMRVVLERNRDDSWNGVRDSYALMFAHGRSDARRRRFQYAVEGVDAIITAHTHDPSVQRPARLVFTGKNNVVVRPLVSIVATSWLRYGGYAADALMLPNATSCPQCLTLEYTGSNNRRGSIRVAW